MRRIRVMVSAAALAGICAAGAWAAEPAAPPRARAAAPEIRQEAKALRIGRLEMMRQRIDIALLREKGAPAREIEAAQTRLRALQEREARQWGKFRSDHPVAARRLMMARRAQAGRGMAGRWGMRPGGPMRGMGPGARMRGMGWGMQRRWMPGQGMGPGMGPGAGRGWMPGRGMGERGPMGRRGTGATGPRPRVDLNRIHDDTQAPPAELPLEGEQPK